MQFLVDASNFSFVFSSDCNYEVQCSVVEFNGILYRLMCSCGFHWDIASLMCSCEVIEVIV